MATKKKTARSGAASAFIRDALTANPKVSAKEVEQAWKKAGNKTDFSGSLYYQIKGKMGLSSKKKKRRKKAAAAEAAPAAADPGAEFLAIEKALDSLISKAEELKDTRLAEALRMGSQAGWGKAGFDVGGSASGECRKDARRTITGVKRRSICNGSPSRQNV